MDVYAEVLFYGVLSVAIANVIGFDAAPAGNRPPPILVMHLNESSGHIKSSELMVNRTYDIFIIGYPNEKDLLIMDFSKLGKNKLKIFGERVNAKTTCLAYHMKSEATQYSCRSVWLKQFQSCPLQTTNTQTLLMTLSARDLRSATLISYKTVNCATGEEQLTEKRMKDCQPSVITPKASSDELTRLEFILLVALAFTSCTAIIFASILLSIQCRKGKKREESSVKRSVSFEEKDLGHRADGPILVDNILYAPVGGEATRL